MKYIVLLNVQRTENIRKVSSYGDIKMLYKMPRPARAVSRNVSQSESQPSSRVLSSPRDVPPSRHSYVPASRHSRQNLLSYRSMVPPEGTVDCAEELLC